MLCNSSHGADSHGSPRSQGCRVIRKHTAKTHRRGSSECSVSWERLVEVVIQELREKQGAPGSWNRYLSVSRSMTCVPRAALWFPENRGQSKTGHPSVTQMAHLWPSRSSKLPLHSCHGDHSAKTPEAMERGEGRWRRHVVTFLEKPICSFLSENHIGEVVGWGKEWVLGCRREGGTDFKT